MKPKPYVGITGFKYFNEVRDLTLNCFQYGYLDFDSRYQVMFGVVTSSKRLQDKRLEGTSSPALMDVNGLLALCSRGVLPMMHYFTENKDNLANEVVELFNYQKMYENNYCRALQINNTSWPVVEQVERIKATFPEMQIVLQLPRQVLQGESPQALATRAKEYSTLADYCLIDPSGGEGKDFSLEFSADLMAALDEEMPQTRIGVAGGLSPGNVYEKVSAVTERYEKPFCIDVQGKVRTEDGKAIDPVKAKNYLFHATRVLKDKNLL